MVLCFIWRLRALLTQSQDRIAVRKEYEKGVFSISELGPYLVVGQYLSPDAAAGALPKHHVRVLLPLTSRCPRAH